MQHIQCVHICKKEPPKGQRCHDSFQSFPSTKLSWRTQQHTQLPKIIYPAPWSVVKESLQLCPESSCRSDWLSRLTSKSHRRQLTFKLEWKKKIDKGTQQSSQITGCFCVFECNCHLLAFQSVIWTSHLGLHPPYDIIVFVHCFFFFLLRYPKAAPSSRNGHWQQQLICIWY